MMAMPMKCLGNSTSGFSGVAIMVGPEALAGIDTDVLAQLAVLGAGICYALGTVYARLRLKPFGINPIASAGGQVAGATVFMVPLALSSSKIAHSTGPMVRLTDGVLDIGI